MPCPLLPTVNDSEHITCPNRLFGKLWRWVISLRVTSLVLRKHGDGVVCTGNMCSWVGYLGTEL